jgi:mannose-6-phosphate isomerase
LQRLPLNSGDAVYVPGGCVHAIGEGCLLLEVQQNSDTTYRVYDWGRLDPLGKPRELHLSQAMRSIVWNDSGPVLIPARKTATPNADAIDEIVTSPYFRMERLTFSNALDCSNDGASFHALFVVSGGVRIDVGGASETAAPGVSCLMAAAISSYRLTPRNTPAVVLRISVPVRAAGQ